MQTKLNEMNWWARKTDGGRVQWTAQYRAWDINFTAWSKPDADGQRYPQWLAQRDNGVMANTRAPHLIGFNVHGKTNDYRFFRYAFSSCLLGDGFFCFTDDAKGYSSVSWFDEFDFKLGAAISMPSTAEWTNGVWRRDFERGIALVNPTKRRLTVELEPGFRRLPGNQDPAANDGNPVASITLEAKDGIILCRP